MIPIPATAWKIALVATLLVGGAWYKHHVYESGYTAGVAAQKAVDAQVLAAANTANRKRETELQAQVDQSENVRATENAQHKTDLENERARARAGAIRLSIPGACPRPAGAGAQAETAARPGQEERTDLLPATADAVLGIAGDSAQVVRDYNALLDRYNAVCQ